MSQLITIEEQGVIDAIEERLRSDGDWAKLRELDRILGEQPQVHMPLHHVFTPGLYVREICIPKGTVTTTRIHLKEHPFVISHGLVLVREGDRWVKLGAPYLGVTEPGARRVIVALEDTIWSTFHVTDKTDPDEIARDVTYCGGNFKELGIAAAVPELTEARG